VPVFYNAGVKPDRNDACPCGSGRKYKHCCGQVMAPPARGLSVEPGPGVAWKIRGDALAEASRWQEAVSCYERALDLQPAFVEAHNNLGNALLRLGRLDEALVCYRQVVQSAPNVAETHSNLSKLLLDLHRYDEAIASGRHAVKLNPRLAEAHANLGNALLDADRVREAVDCYHSALAINPAFPEVHNSLGNAERSLANFDLAMAHYRRALELMPEYAEVHNNLGVTLRLSGHTAQAEASCRRALELEPTLMAALAALGEMAADRGEFDRAEQLLRNVVAQAPDNVEAWISLGRQRKMTAADSDWLQAALKLLDRPLRPRERISLHYALGKYFDDIGDFERAFSYYRQANEITRGHAPAHDRQQARAATDCLIRRFDRDRVSTPSRSGNPSTRPVFIVGMPRSGTSLAEQILASHRCVFGAGELTYWERAANVTDAARLSELADSYLQLLSRLSPEADRVVDKMPTNFVSLGAIHAALPNARIIHMQRNPVDTCLSIYFQDFGSNIPYANDLDDLANFYREYLRLMRHWRETLGPEVLLDVPYEALVADQELWSRRMIEFIALPWDERCLEFHRTDRSVVTASKWQVRQKINTASIERWRRYEKHIGPLRSLLEDGAR
jgi:tetratricopeptide (TPR) repeat protein